MMFVLCALMILNLSLTGYVVYRLYGKSAAEKLDDAVEEETARRSREMDEGFDNLMRYSVRGMDGFGGAE
jgi:hypothetical protein